MGVEVHVGAGIVPGEFNVAEYVVELFVGTVIAETILQYIWREKLPDTMVTAPAPSVIFQ